MPQRLTLFDLVSPYVLGSGVFGQWQETLGAHEVQTLDFAGAEAGAVVNGVAELPDNAQLTFDPSSQWLQFVSGAQSTDGNNPVLDFSKVKIHMIWEA